MKITDPGLATLQAATVGDLAAIEQLLLAIQPGVFNLGIRILGNREDAADATQEILLKVVTHLSSFRGEAGFTTWVWRIAHNHLMSAATRSKESPEVSLEALTDRLQQGLDFGASTRPHDGPRHEPHAQSPQDKLEARQVALACTQHMLMTLDRPHRSAFVLDAVVGLPSSEAAQVLEISPEAYRQRVSRARAKLDRFAGATCGLANPRSVGGRNPGPR